MCVKVTPVSHTMRKKRSILHCQLTGKLGNLSVLVCDHWGFPTVNPWCVREGDSCFAYNEKEKKYFTLSIDWEAGEFGYLVIRSLGSLGHLVTRSFSHLVTSHYSSYFNFVTD